MSTEPKDLEQNALASRLARGWSNFKQGKLISYKMMALLLLVVAGLGLWWYIAAERKKGVSRRWVDFDEATTPEKLDDLAKKYPNTPLAAYSLLGVARGQLGPDGIDVLNSTNIAKRPAALENIEKARKALSELLEQFKDDPVGKAECYLGLAKAEMALYAVPEKADDLTKYKGDLAKVREYLEELSKVAAPDTPWATDSKKLADALGKEPTADEFTRIQRGLFEMRSPLMGRPAPIPLPPGVGAPPITGIPGGK